MCLVSFCKDNTISCLNNTISCLFFLFDNQHFTIYIKNIYHFMYFVLKLYISLTYKLITNIMKATISTGQSKELVKEIATELTVNFMRLGLTQEQAVKMSKQAILENYKLFKNN